MATGLSGRLDGTQAASQDESKEDRRMVRASQGIFAAIVTAVVAAAGCSRPDATQGAERPSLAPTPASTQSATHLATPAATQARAPVTAAAPATLDSIVTPAPKRVAEPVLQELRAKEHAAHVAGGPVVVETEASLPSTDDPACPSTMVLVDGNRCTDVKQECVEWLDAKGSHLARCARYAPSVCSGDRVHERFCIDRDEYVAPGQTLPAGHESWTQARATCVREGKRLCRESEWELACEGEEAFPYTTGYERDSAACNFDKDHLVDPASGKLRDQREPSSALDRCVSPYGVRSMTGNVDEWVWRDHTAGTSRAALKGGWWMAARERCRPATTWHGEKYSELQTGFRCCADPPG
jgi:formylglycine-generating enzyme required for sulfatase activity